MNTKCIELIFDNISLYNLGKISGRIKLVQGELVKLSGINGLGKSSLLKFIVENKFFFNLKEEIIFCDQTSIESFLPLGLNDLINSLSKENSQFNREHFNHSFFELFPNEFQKNNDINLFSGGMKQILKILIALNCQANIYFFDEPFAQLDQEKQNYIAGKIIKLRNDNKKILIVDHQNFSDDNHIDPFYSHELFLKSIGNQNLILVDYND